LALNDITKLSVRQFTVLVMLFTIGTTILIIPSDLASVSKQDAWIAAIIGILLGLLFVLLISTVGNRFGQKTLVQYNEELFGKWLGTIVSSVFIFYSFIGSATLLYYVGNFMTTQVMPETPMLYINILFMSMVVVGTRLGIETIARSAEIFFPWFLMLFLVMAAFVSPQIKAQNIQPVLEAGVKPLVASAISYVGTAALTLISFLMIFPAKVRKPAKARNAFLIGSVLGGLFIVVITFLTIAVLGTETTSRHLYPSYALAKKISVGNFVERIESVMAGLWFMSIFYKLTLYFYGFVMGLAQTLHLKDHRPIVFPLGMIVVVYSLVVYPDVNYAGKWDTTVWIPYIFTIALGLPLLLLIVGAMRKKFGKTE